MATFTDANPQARLSDFSASIDWGDGSKPDTKARIMLGDDGSFHVLGRHTYRQEGSYTAVVTITDIGGATAEADDTVTVDDAPLNAVGVALSAAEGRALKGALVATFTDTDPHARAGDFSATIDWGDGSKLDTKAMIVRDGHGTFQVLGHHRYADEGTFNVVVTITDAGGSSAEADSTVTVADAPLSATGIDISPVTGVLFQGAVARFTDMDHRAPLGDFSVTIDWGDGSDLDTTATIMPDQHHGFLVLGSHTYDQADTFTITITITDLGGSLATATATALVTDGPGYLSSGTHQPNAPIAITFTASARAAILTKPAQPPDAKRDQAVIQVNGRFPAEMVTYMTSAPALPDLRSDGLEGLPYVDLLPALGDHSGPMMDSFFSREDWYV